jgi:hypothetical protein
MINMSEAQGMGVHASSALSAGRTNAQHFTGSAMPAAVVVTSYASRSADPLAIMEELKLKSTSVCGGNMELLEQMLLHQAVALQTMFMDLAVRAKAQDSLAGVQTLTQLALKAQSGSRATLQTLAELKNPRPVFVRQTNVAQHQQVNNGIPPPTRAKKQRTAPIELKAPGRTPMATRHWTLEQRQQQAERIRLTRPWDRSTGPRSAIGKQVSSRNADRGGVRFQLRRFSRELTTLLGQQRSLVR